MFSVKWVDGFELYVSGAVRIKHRGPFSIERPALLSTDDGLEDFVFRTGFSANSFLTAFRTAPIFRPAPISLVLSTHGHKYGNPFRPAYGSKLFHPEGVRGN